MSCPMHYANIDVMSIAPTHLSPDLQPTKNCEEKSYCAICKEEVNIANAKATPETIDDIVMLPCKHPYHYRCLREACRYHKIPKAGRECALCRKPYTPFDIPQGDTYVQHFHKQVVPVMVGKKKVDWDTLEKGDKLFVSHRASKYKCQTVEYLYQTKCQAYVQLADTTSVRLGKNNLFAFM